MLINFFHAVQDICLIIVGWAMRATLFFCLAMLVFAVPLCAQEDIDDEEPIPSSVDQIVAPMDRLVEKKPVPPVLFPQLKELLRKTTPFPRDTSLDLNLRTFYLRKSVYDGSVSEAWAIGGALSYKSGWLFDRVGIGATLYTSQPVYAPENHDGSGLLASGQKGYTVLGQLYGRVRLLEGTFLNLYKFGDFNTPYLSQNDNRMTPYTFEGYTVTGKMGWGGGSSLVFGGGYILKIKDKTSESFIWMSEKAGSEAKRGVATLGARYSIGGFSIGAIDYYSDDIINIGYAETSYTLDLTKELGFRLAAQYTDQRSTGENRLTGSNFSTCQGGVKADMSYRSGIITLAYTANATGQNLVNPWSGYPGFTSSQVTNYSKAGVNAFGARFSYDFTRLGLEGVAAYFQYVHGWGMVDQKTKAPLPNEDEFNSDLQWRPKWRYLEGLWLRGRYAVVHQNEEPRQYTHDCRITVNYDITLM